MEDGGRRPMRRRRPRRDEPRQTASESREMPTSSQEATGDAPPKGRRETNGAPPNGSKDTNNSEGPKSQRAKPAARQSTPNTTKPLVNGQ